MASSPSYRSHVGVVFSGFPLQKKTGLLMLWNPKQSKLSPKPFCVSSKRSMRVFLLPLLLLAGLLALPCRAASSASQPTTEDLLRQGITAAMVQAAASGGITNDVASILAFLNALRYSTSSSGNMLTVVPMASANVSFLQAFQRALNEVDQNNRESSFLYEIQRALWGERSIPSGHDTSIAGILEGIDSHLPSNVWTRADINLLLSSSNVWTRADIASLLGRTNVWSASNVTQLLAESDLIVQYLYTMLYSLTYNNRSWQVMWDPDWKSDIEGILDSTMGGFLSSMSNLISHLEATLHDDNGDLLDGVTSIGDLVNYIYGTFVDSSEYQRQFFEDWQDFAFNILTDINSMPSEISSSLSTLIDNGSAEIRLFRQKFEDMMDYPRGVSQYSLLTDQYYELTNIVAILRDMTDPDSASLSAASNALSQAAAAQAQAETNMNTADDSVTELANDDDTEPDWERHRYTNNPLDQFDNSWNKPEQMFRAFTTGPENVRGETVVTLYNGNFPIFGGAANSSQTRSRSPARTVPLNVSFALDSSGDPNVAGVMSDCHDIFGWVWDVCAAVLIGWLYKKFADWVAAPKLLTA